MRIGDKLYSYPEAGFLDCNTYVIAGSPGIIVDPGSRASLNGLVEEMGKDGIEPGNIGVIVNTHLHGDHCGVDGKFRELSGARIMLHPLQKQFYNITVVETAKVFGLPPVHVEEDDVLKGDELDGTGLEMIPAPGHSPDSICLYNRDDRVLICGDVIFAGNVGRVDLPGGDAGQLEETVNRLSGLEIETLLPGHMNVINGDADRVRQNFELIKNGVLKWL